MQEKELILASAQFYCEQTLCKIKPEEMAGNVFFVSPTRFVEEAEKDAGRKYTKEEVEDDLTKRVEMVNKQKQSFINEDLSNKFIEMLKQGSPEEVRQLGNRDFAMVFTKSLMFHIFSHMNQIDTTYPFSGFSMRGIPSRNGIINVPNIDRLEGFTFAGETEDKKPFYINGVKEAITELTAITIGEKSGGYMSIVQEYNDGAMLIDEINKRSGITDQEFLEYANGFCQIKGLLTKWGR